MSKLKGRHWVFIIGFISVIIVSLWSENISYNIIELMALMGVGLFLKDIFAGE